jgi:outer membrane biosynthesis protein TonB
MRPSSTTAALLIGGVLALLLVAYVFSGNARRRADSDPHCVSGPSLDLVKGELFRRAAAVRGTTDPAFADAASHGVARSVSQMIRRHYGGSHEVTCTGSIAIDLPPGVAAVGGRHSLMSAVRYKLAPGRDGSARLMALARADAIVGPLATITGEAGQQSAPPVKAAAVPQPRSSALPAVAQRTPRPVPRAPPKTPAATRVEKAGPQKPAARTNPKPGPQKPAAGSRQAPAAPHKDSSVSRAADKKAAPAASKSRPGPETAKAKPSFNCRFAKTRGEIAVCNNPTLAALDREMSAQFFSALSAAAPSERAILRRTRDRFLSYRDSCNSDTCIADAYRGRMREIDDIMAGRL